MLPFKIIPDDGEPFEIVATSRDVAKWERVTKGATFGALEVEKKISDLYKIAYHAAKRLGHWDGTLAEFEASCDFDLLDEEQNEPDPTPSAA
jgi:predicted Rdx family selenoprotein